MPAPSANRPTREAVIVDVDGTLCDVRGIRHYVAGSGKRNFDAFHSASALCPPIPETLSWVEGHRRAGREIFIVTARQAKWRLLTQTWLRKWEVSYHHLLMRHDDDFRPDVEVKTDILAYIDTLGFNVVAAIDDNPAVIDLWRANSIPVTVVPGWDEHIR